MKTSNKISVPLRENWKISTGKGDVHEKGVHSTRVKRGREMDVLGALKRESIKFGVYKTKSTGHGTWWKRREKCIGRAKENILANLFPLGDSSVIQGDKGREFLLWSAKAASKRKGS